MIDILHPDPDPDLGNQEGILTSRDNHNKSNKFNKFNKFRMTKVELDPMKE